MTSVNVSKSDLLRKFRGQWTHEQRTLKKRLILEDDFTWDLSLPSDGCAYSDTEDDVEAATESESASSLYITSSENDTGAVASKSGVSSSLPSSSDTASEVKPSWSSIVAASKSHSSALSTDSSSTRSSSSTSNPQPSSSGGTSPTNGVRLTSRQPSNDATSSSTIDNVKSGAGVDGKAPHKDDESESKTPDPACMPSREPILDNGSIKVSQRPGPLRRIAGVDISFVGDSDEDACAALVVLSYPDLKVVYEDYTMVKLKYPYIAGFLAFREVEFLVDLLNKLWQTKPKLIPQVIMVDGNGILHHRGFGLASHLGVLTGIPTIGIGKKLLHVDGLSKDVVNAQVRKHLHKAGEYIELVGQSGTVWGAAFRSTDKSKNAIYVSTGHKVSLATAARITKACCRYRIPEPVRRADVGSREYIRLNYKSESEPINTP